MSQFRKDIFTGRWVIVAEADVVRPSDFHFKKFVRGTIFCPFCETHEASTPPEIFAIRRTGRYGGPRGPELATAAEDCKVNRGGALRDSTT